VLFLRGLDALLHEGLPEKNHPLRRRLMNGTIQVTIIGTGHLIKGRR
jgi:hypothetical protein